MMVAVAVVPTYHSRKLKLLTSSLRSRRHRYLLELPSQRIPAKHAPAESSL